MKWAYSFIFIVDVATNGVIILKPQCTVELYDWLTFHLSCESLWWSTNRGHNDVVMTVKFLVLSLPALLIVFLFTSLLLCLLHSIGGSIPIVFSYYSEFLAQEKRGEHLSWLCMFWMIGGIYAAAMAWAIIPHYGKKTNTSNMVCCVNTFILMC